MTVEIRSGHDEDVFALAAPLTRYAFQASPAAPGPSPSSVKPAAADPICHVAIEDGRPVATVRVHSMRQNVRDAVVPMAGVAGVATHPEARRRGHMRTLLSHALVDARDRGLAVSCLYPVRASFYERFGYVSLPRPITATLSPAALIPTLRAEVEGEVRLRSVAEGGAEAADFIERHVAAHHGRVARVDQLREFGEVWLAIARRAGEVVGLMAYKLSGFAGELTSGLFLCEDPAARLLLLQWIARHDGQIASVRLALPPDAHPELWCTDLAVKSVVDTVYPGSPAPMARLLSLDALNGMRTSSEASVTVAVTDVVLGADSVSHLIGGDGRHVTVQPATGEPALTITGPALAALAYGVQSSIELAAYGHLRGAEADQRRLDELFPAASPYLAASF
jgi:GNAT superfamily N-acetyltransferase